jgi:hypothetical protein
MGGDALPYTVVAAGRSEDNLTFATTAPAGNTVLSKATGGTDYTFIVSIDASTNPPTNTFALRIGPTTSNDDQKETIKTDSDGNIYFAHTAIENMVYFGSANGTDLVVNKRTPADGGKYASYLAKVGSRLLRYINQPLLTAASRIIPLQCDSAGNLLWTTPSIGGDNVDVYCVSLTGPTTDGNLVMHCEVQASAFADFTPYPGFTFDYTPPPLPLPRSKPWPSQ